MYMELIFAHNTHNRFRTLQHTINIEKNMYDSKHYVSITDNGGISIKEDIYAGHIIIPGIHHQINCVNAFYGLISKICEEHNDGVIVFSHDDIYIENKSVVDKNIDLLINNDYSFILRQPNREKFGENYYMMEVVYLRILHIREKFKPFTNSILDDMSKVPLDLNNWKSAEVWLGNFLSDVKNNYIYEYKEWSNDVSSVNKNLIDTLGFYHLNLGQREWNE